jgi:hypothetical protein
VRSSDLAVDRGPTDGEQFRKLSDRVLAAPWSLSKTTRWVGLSLDALPLSLPLARAIAIPSRVRIRNRSTSNSAKVARILKKHLPIGSLGS